ncbi:MAG: penicillin-binding protein 2 [Candidatus Binatia bacterium]
MFTLTSQKEVAPEFRRRTHLLITVTSIFFLFLLGRLLVLQFFQGERFTYLSKNNRIRIKKIPGTRGMVFDRNDRLLIDSHPSFDLLFVPEDATEPKVTLRYLARSLGEKEDKFLVLLDRYKMRPPFKEIVLERDIDWNSVVTVESHQLELPGVTLWIRPKRSYLDHRAGAHVLGYVGEISPRQLKAQRKSGYTLGDEIGKFGLEKNWEDVLRGQNGGQQVEVDALGRQVKIVHEVKDVPGYNVFLTLDQTLQETATQALEKKAGAIVALDIHTGAILALVSSPAFDPNVFARGITSEAWHALIQDHRHPLNNRAIQGQYPPGSTFKIVVAIAALEEGLIQPQTSIFDPGFLMVGKRRFRCWKAGGHGWVNLNRAIIESCDVYFYQLGQRVGVDRIAQYARALGLGEKTGVALDGEKAGLIPNSIWKKHRFGEPWYPGETPSIAIGQGYVTVTPLQMANLMAAVANGGTLYRPWFVRRVESLHGTLIREYGPEKVHSLALKKTTLQTIHRALRDVVNSERGTGQRARSNLVKIAGKTGTAQVTRMRGQVVKSKHLPYEIRDHAWFVAYAPVEKPEIAVAVLVEHGGHGGSAAAPLAKSLIEKYFLLKRNPSGEKDPGRQEGAHAD